MEQYGEGSGQQHQQWQRLKVHCGASSVNRFHKTAVLLWEVRLTQH